MSYYNTNNLTGNQLKLYKRKAVSQEDRIYEFLKSAGPYHWHTPDAILQWLYPDGLTPITSVRRALTCLEHKGKIIRSQTANAHGSYGHPVHTYCWKGDR